MMDANMGSAHNKDFFDDFIVNAPRPAAHGDPVSLSELLDTTSRAGQLLSSMQQQPMPNGVDMNVLEGLMAMQDNRGGQSNAMTSTSQPTPQVLMEQQMRLNQLQQLYQLQTQIFQQQVSIQTLVYMTATICVEVAFTSQMNTSETKNAGMKRVMTMVNLYVARVPGCRHDHESMGQAADGWNTPRGGSIIQDSVIFFAVFPEFSILF